MPEFAQFNEVARHLEETMKTHRSELKMVEDRIRNLRVILLAVMVIAALSVWLGGKGLSLANDVESFTKQRAKDTAAARISSCVQFNDNTRKIREAFVQSLVAVLPPGQAPTEPQQQLIERYRTQVEKTLRYRDCSPAGIQAFFADPPSDPALKEAS